MTTIQINVWVCITPRWDTMIGHEKQQIVFSTFYWLSGDKHIVLYNECKMSLIFYIMYFHELVTVCLPIHVYDNGMCGSHKPYAPKIYTQNTLSSVFP